MSSYIGAKAQGLISNIDGGTIENATLASSVVFPAGHLIKTTTLAHVKSAPSHILANNSSVIQDSGIAGSFTTLMSSSDSFLEFEFYSSMAYVNNSASVCVTHFLLSSSDSTTYSSSNSIHGTYPHYYEPKVSGIFTPVYFKSTYRAGVQTPSGLSSYSAEQTLYFRIFIYSNDGNIFIIVHQNSEYFVRVREYVI